MNTVKGSVLFIISLFFLGCILIYNPGVKLIPGMLVEIWTQTSYHLFRDLMPKSPAHWIYPEEVVISLTVGFFAFFLPSLPCLWEGMRSTGKQAKTSTLRYLPIVLAYLLIPASLAWSSEDAFKPLPGAYMLSTQNWIMLGVVLIPACIGIWLLLVQRKTLPIRSVSSIASSSRMPDDRRETISQDTLPSLRDPSKLYQWILNSKLRKGPSTLDYLEDLGYVESDLINHYKDGMKLRQFFAAVPRSKETFHSDDVLKEMGRSDLLSEINNVAMPSSNLKPAHTSAT